MVQALAADAAQEPLAHGVGLRRADGRAQDRDAAGRSDPREGRPELAVVVADQIARALAEGGGLAPLLGDPGVGRVARRADMDDPARGQFDDEEGEDRPEQGVRHRQEVAGPDVRGVGAQEGRPGLPPWSWGGGHGQVRLDGTLGHADAQLPELAPDPLRPPERVVGGHPPDQGDGLCRERRATRPRARLPPPERAEPGTLPAQQGLGLDDQQGLPPGADAARQQHQHRPICMRHDWARHATAQYQELLAQQGVLGEQLRPAPHHIGPGPGRMRERQRPRPQACAERATHPGTDLPKPLAATANAFQRWPPH